MTKIINFFKKFWWLFLAPIGLFLVSYLFKKDSSELESKIKSKKAEIEEVNNKVEEQKTKVEESSSNLDKSIQETKDTIEVNLDNKRERDSEAEKFFPDL